MLKQINVESHLFVFGEHHSRLTVKALLRVLLSNIARCSLLNLEDLSKAGGCAVPNPSSMSDPILWSWFSPIPWSCSGGKPASKLASSNITSSNVVHLLASSFVSFFFFFEYFSKSSLIFNWSGWWLFKMYNSCLETEHRSRVGSTSS